MGVGSDGRVNSGGDPPFGGGELLNPKVRPTITATRTMITAQDDMMKRALGEILKERRKILEHCTHFLFFVFVPGSIYPPYLLESQAHLSKSGFGRRFWEKVDFFFV